jgi:alpha-mannosidase
MRIAKKVGISIVSRVSLAPGIPRIDIHTEINNQAEDHRLRVNFSAPFVVDQADYDGHFEIVHRTLDIPKKGKTWVEDPRPEVPQRAFVDISNGEAGLMLANRGLPEVEVLRTPSGTEIALTLLRCVGWLSRDDLPVRPGHAGPGFETPGGQMPGKWVFDYALIPHPGDWQAVYPQAYAFEAPLRAMGAKLQHGKLPPQGSFISHSPAEFVISALKETEDGRGWILRGYNITEKPVEVTLKPLWAFGQAARINLAEEFLETLSPEEDGSVHLSVGGYEVATVRFMPSELS